MTRHDLVGRIGKGVGRRGFLARAGAASMGAAFAVIGLPNAASADAQPQAVVKCCLLCHSPSSSCCGSRPPFCVWSWTCCHSDNRRRYRCSEYYCGSGACNAGCAGVNCSRITEVGGC